MCDPTGPSPRALRRVTCHRPFPAWDVRQRGSGGDLEAPRSTGTVQDVRRQPRPSALWAKEQHWSFQHWVHRIPWTCQRQWTERTEHRRRTGVVPGTLWGLHGCQGRKTRSQSRGRVRREAADAPERELGAASRQQSGEGGAAPAQEPGRWRAPGWAPQGRACAGTEPAAPGFQSNGGEEGRARSRWPPPPPPPRGAGHSPGQTQVLLLWLGSSPGGLCHTDAGR